MDDVPVKGRGPIRRARTARCALHAALLALCALAPSRGAHAQASPDSSARGATRDTTPVPQRDVIDVLGKMVGRKVQEPAIRTTPTPGLAFTLLPSIGYNPSYGGFIGVSAGLGGWLGDPANTTPSAGAAGASYSTTGQISVQLKTDFYTSGNRYVLKGDWRYLDTSQPTYGLGPAEEDRPKYPMNFLLYRFYQSVYKRVPDSWFFVGVGYHLDVWDQVSVEVSLPGGPYETYSGGPVSHSVASGVSANVLYDSRDNPINARRGTYWNASLRTYNKVIGSDENWQALWSDLRVYPGLPRGGPNTLAIWNYLWFTFGKAPYLDLPSTGWDTYGRGARGWLQGAIRGESQVYTEGEYRMRLTRDGLVGAVTFLNLTSTIIPASGQFGKFDPGFGAGLRIKYSKRTDTNLAVDSAWDAFWNWHLFFGMQEVF